MQLRSRTWWIVWVSLLAGGAAISVWMWMAQPVAVARSVNGALDLLAAGWLGLGLWRWREQPVVRRVGWIVVATAAAAVVVNGLLGFGLDRWVRAVAGLWAMSVGFYLALQMARWMLGISHPALGVARTLLDEALSMKAAVAILVIVFVIVPFLPLMLQGEPRLSYRLQSFLTYAMIGVTTLLSLLTIVIGVTSITRELSDRQIFLTLTKPVGRGQYLLGKWLGLAVLNALLVGVSGVGIYTYARLIADQPGMNEGDVAEASEQVLTARRRVQPVAADPRMLDEAFTQRLETLRQQDAATYGRPGESQSLLSPAARAAIQQQVVVAWQTLRPQATQAYLFTGLLPARTAARTVQLRLKPKAAATAADDVVYLAMRFNEYDDRVELRKLAEGKFHVVDVPTELINDRGELKVEIYNPARPDGAPTPSISFNPADGLSMLYRVGSFESNVAGAMVLLWLRLCFLGMLALAAGTFLGFHVAALLATMVAVAASGSSFLLDSITQYGAFPQPAVTLWDQLLFYPGKIADYLHEGKNWRAVQVVIGMIGAGFMKLIPDFGRYSGTSSLAYGLAVSGDQLLKAALQVGVLWTGVTGIGAWLAFRRREVARVQV